MGEGLKYSIPNNYIIAEYNGLKGIQRKDKNGTKWLWEPLYKQLIVSKTFGKIIVAHLSAMSGEDFIRIGTYKGDMALGAKVYDLILGENCLYVKTVRPSTGNLEWCKVNEDLQGGTFLGDFEMVGRSASAPFHIPVGTLSIAVKVDGVDKKLILHTGEFEDVIKHAEKPQEEVVNRYNIFINPDTKSVQLLHPVRNTLIKQSTCIGEIEVYAEIIKSMMGGLENVPKSKAEKLIDFLSAFEHYGNGIALPVLFEYVKARTDGDIEAILDGMINELKIDWKDFSADYSVKIYTSGSIIMALVKTKNSKITVAPYMINGDDGVLEVNEVEALLGSYKATGVKTARLDVKSVTLDETVTDKKEINKWPSPYSIRQRSIAASDVKEFTYQKVDVFFFGTDVLGKDGKIYGDVGLSIAICDRFTYRSRKMIYGKTGNWITTNTYSAQVV